MKAIIKVSIIVIAIILTIKVIFNFIDSVSDNLQESISNNLDVSRETFELTKFQGLSN